MPAPQLHVHRVAVRLLIVDPCSRLLLQHWMTPDTGEEFWCTPGGALDKSETPGEAARRELYEEEGLQLSVQLDAPVWERMHVFTIGDSRVFHQHELYHVLRIAAFEPSPARLSDFERRSIIEQRWWSLDELRAADRALLNPPELPRLLANVLASAGPSPVEAGARTIESMPGATR